jgi:hypothetical protein
MAIEGPARFRASFTANNDGAIMEKADMAKVEGFLRRTFANAALRVVPRAKKKDSAEVYIGDEFIGVLSEDIDEGEKSYFFEMAILDTDLED